MLQVWQEVAGQFYFAVLTFQTIMFGLFLIKGAPIQTILTVPLPILTISLWRSSDVLFRPPQQRLSLEAAADLDQRDQVCALAHVLARYKIMHLGAWTTFDFSHIGHSSQEW